MQLTVNGESHELAISPERLLLSVLRNDLGLTGTKYGCGEGNCGACTVLVDGEPTRSCITPAAAAAGRTVITIEGLAGGERLHPVQGAFVEHTAFQCGYCTPGFIISATALLTRNPDPSEAETIAALNGHMCRCGAYVRIKRAVRSAAEKMAEEVGDAT
jgi:aerobic-type carbon monoxide dehydrogenase small subunit (CoxS/CutS family)